MLTVEQTCKIHSNHEYVVHINLNYPRIKSVVLAVVESSPRIEIPSDVCRSTSSLGPSETIRFESYLPVYFASLTFVFLTLPL